MFDSEYCFPEEKPTTSVSNEEDEPEGMVWGRGRGRGRGGCRGRGVRLLGLHCSPSQPEQEDRDCEGRGRYDESDGRSRDKGIRSVSTDDLDEGLDREMREPNASTPQEPAEDDEIFENQFPTGINFSRCDDSEVKVTGENVPPPIESFETAGLHEFLLNVLTEHNYVRPSSVQKYAIPIIMSGRDMMACVPTGSGKTAAFLIPIINELLVSRMEGSKGCYPQAIIVSPTRELTIQIYQEAKKFSSGSFLKVAVSFGGTSLCYQIKMVKKGCNILVATPSRLLDFVRRKIVKLHKVKFVVLNEGDRMFALGFLNDLVDLLSHDTMPSPTDKQTVMFSATFPEEIQTLAKTFLSDYIFLAVGVVDGARADVEQRVFLLRKPEKRHKAVQIITESPTKKYLIFVENQRQTDVLATYFSEMNLSATSIHDARLQEDREEALKEFEEGIRKILLVTAVASRGLDIIKVDHVINFDMPLTIEEYIRRIGRIGRLGNPGLASSFYDPVRDSDLAPDLVRVLTQTNQEIPDFLKKDSLEYAVDPSESDVEENMTQSQFNVLQEEEW